LYFVDSILYFGGFEMYKNQVLLMGNVGADPVVHTFADGREILSFSLATSERWKDKVTGEQKEKTEWHKVTTMLPTVINYAKTVVKKGAKIYIEGSLNTREYTTKDGVKGKETNVIAKQICLFVATAKETAVQQPATNGQTVYLNDDDWAGF
jgi:single stranded DNA-binding protein